MIVANEVNMNELIVKASIDVAAPARNVWRTLTEPALTRKYMFGCAAVSDWRVGSTLDWVASSDGKEVTYVKGRIVALEPERRLDYTTFGLGMGLDDVPENYLTVSVRLDSDGKTTRVAVTQGDYAQVADGQKRYDDTVGGWDKVLAQIKTLAEAL